MARAVSKHERKEKYELFSFISNIADFCVVTFTLTFSRVRSTFIYTYKPIIDTNNFVG